MYNNDFNEVASIQFDLENAQYQETITSGIESAVPTITVGTVDVNEDVVVTLEIVVDANEADNDLTQAAWQSEQLLSDFDVNVESKFFTFFKSYAFFVVRFIRDSRTNFRSFGRSYDVTSNLGAIYHWFCFNDRIVNYGHRVSANC